MTTETQPATDLPAIAGGTPAKTVPYSREIRYGEEELKELKEAIEQNTLFYAHGKKVSQMEQEFARMNGAKFCVATTSGTASIHAALIAIGLSPGEEVITAPITDMGTVIPILFQGGIPVFADLDPLTYNMLPESVEKCITPKTRAVLAVNLWGNACDLNALKTICDKHDLVLIEDCAQAFGCIYDGKPIGTIGKVGCFSLNEFKHISCGDGGVVITNDDKMALQLRLSTDKCYSRDPSVNIRRPLFLANNYRMTELQGAVALAQMRKLDSIVARRRRFCEGLSEQIKDLKGITLPTPTDKCNPSWWFYMIRVQEDILGVDTDEFTKALKAEGIPAGAHYIQTPVYTYPVFVEHSAFQRGSHPYAEREYGFGLCPNAEEILKTCVMISLNPAYSQQDLEETVHGFRKVVSWFLSKK